MFNYSFKKDNGKVVIKTPKVDSFDDIKKEIKQTSDCIVNHSVYPNGLDVTVSQFCDKIIVTSNKELVQIDEDTYCFKD